MYDYKVIFLPSIIKPEQSNTIPAMQDNSDYGVCWTVIQNDNSHTKSNNVANCQHLFAYLNY